MTGEEKVGRTWAADFDPRERSIVEFMAEEFDVIPTEDTAQELLLAFEDSEELQAAYRCRPLTAAGFNDNQI